MKSLITADRSSARQRLIIGIAFLSVWFVVFRETLGGLYHLARTDEGHSHILAIPILAAYFIYADRKKLFGDGWTEPGLQILLSGLFLATGGILFVLGIQSGSALVPIDALSLSTASAVFLLIGLVLAFVPGINIAELFFPGFLVLLIIPLPHMVSEGLVSFLVNGSVFFTEMLFKISGTTFYREGTIFLLNGISIEIANECSGIRSSIGLFLTLLMANHMFLSRWWSKTTMMAMLIPMVLVKNAIRITTLTLLAVHMDRAFLVNSPLHHSGGVVFFALALLLILPVLVALRKLEKRFRKSGKFFTEISQV